MGDGGKLSIKKNSEDDFMKDYPSANLVVVKKAVLELKTEGKVTITQ